MLTLPDAQAFRLFGSLDDTRHIPSWFLADDPRDAQPIRTIITGLPDRPGTIR